MVKHDRLHELEGLRGALSWWVVIGHVAYFYNDAVGDLLAPSDAVHAFIILSGFVVTRLLLQRREAYAPFITRRFFRLAPAYLVFLGLSALTLGLQQANLMALGGEGSRYAYRILLMNEARDALGPHLLAHATMLHGILPEAWLPDSAYTVMGQAWSISVEWQFYLLAPLLVAGIARPGRPRLLAIGLALLLVVLRFVPGMPDTPAFLPQVFAFFAVGALCYLLWEQRARRAFQQVGLIVTIAMALAATLHRDLGLFAWSIMFCALIGRLPLLTWPLLAVLRSAPMQFLGRSSYSAYLCHMLVIFIVLGPVVALGLERGATVLLTLGLTVPLTIIVAQLSYRFVERPSMNAGAWIVRPARAAVQPAAVPAAGA